MKKILFHICCCAIMALSSVSCSSEAEVDDNTSSESAVAPELGYRRIPELFTIGNAFAKNLYAKGKITNIGTITAYSIEVTITFYDEHGTIKNVNEDYFYKLSAGESWEYAIYYEGGPIDLDAGITATAEVIAYSDPDENPKPKITYN